MEEKNDKEKLYVPLEGSEIPQVFKSIVTKKERASSQEIVEVCLCLRSRGPLPSEEEITQRPLSQRKRLSQKQFEKLYGADPEDVRIVEDFLWKHGINSIEKISLTQRCIIFTVTVAIIEKIFGVELCMYEHEGKSFRGHGSTLNIPNEWENIVIGVFGVSDLPLGKGHIRGPIIRKQWLLQLKKEEEKGKFNISPFFTPSQLAQPEAYNFPTSVNGKGETIGLLELSGDYYRQYLDNYGKEYLDEYFAYINAIEKREGKDILKTPPITSVNCGCSAYNNTGQDPMGDAEVWSDIEVAGALANGAKLVVYFENNKNEFGFLRVLWTAVTDFKNHPSIISISWGGNEDLECTEMFKYCMNLWLWTAAAINITVCVGSGDTGSSDCGLPLNGPDDDLPHLDFPASSPWALACGGTWLQTKNETIEGEVTWNDGKILGATGGGVSTYFPLPGYQEGCKIKRLPPMPYTQCEEEDLTKRGVPDVAGTASTQSGYFLMASNGLPFFGGGTSLSAPLWAALIALLNEKLRKEKKLNPPRQLGFINPLLYKICNEGQYSEAFRDIKVGNNQNFPSVPGYSATPGWDACTGLGTPNGMKLYEAILKMLPE